ncbi:MAG: Undecaprenyl-diphosphatase, partial [Phenylobacterium sp.]|nr:Undecaprenyl-diphosphatase [Phenylobacterium sp.]
TSFLVALAVIRAMLAIVTRQGYAPFGWLRILIGGVGLALLTYG